jgi:hypothetical protein
MIAEDQGDGNTSGDADSNHTTETALSDRKPAENADETQVTSNTDAVISSSEENKTENDPTDKVPEDGVYDFGDFDEGIELTDERRESWSKKFQEVNLTQGQVAQLVKMRQEEAKAEYEAQIREVEQREIDHLNAAKNDKEIGGDKWDETVDLAKRGVKALGGNAILELIESTGNGNNPEMLRELRRIGLMVNNDTFENGAANESRLPVEQRWYSQQNTN